MVLQLCSSRITSASLQKHGLSDKVGLRRQGLAHAPPVPAPGAKKGRMLVVGVITPYFILLCCIVELIVHWLLQLNPGGGLLPDLFGGSVVLCEGNGPNLNGATPWCLRVPPLRSVIILIKLFILVLWPLSLASFYGRRLKGLLDVSG